MGLIFAEEGPLAGITVSLKAPPWGPPVPHMYLRGAPSLDEGAPRGP